VLLTVAMLYTAEEAADSMLVLEALAAGLFRRSRLRTLLLVAALEPFARTTNTPVSPEKLTLARLQQEVQAAGADEGSIQTDIYVRFGFRLAQLSAVITALKLPHGVKLPGGDIMTGEEAALISLRRSRTKKGEQ
jgi:hypothetical protein